MANPARTPGKYGLKPRDPDRRVPILEHYLRPWEGPVAPRPRSLTAYGGAGGIGCGGSGGSSTFTYTNVTPQPLPPAFGDINRLTAVADWPMYVNGPDPSNPSYAPNGLGDCFWAGSGHMFTGMRVYAGYPEVHFSSNAIVKGYESTGYIPGNESTDNGTDPAQGLKFLSTTGLVDLTGEVHQVAAYAFFADPRNTNLMAQVLETFGTVGIGFNCTAGYEQAFSEGVPCEWQPGDQVVGGHWVIIQRRSVGGVGILKEITWGSVQAITRRYNWHTVTDAVAIASHDFIAANGETVQGMDFAQLCEDTQDAE